ncbi:MAG: hypothetical protein MAG581_02138 [Deltaproteobacteria bacterium]|jgi:hypothetical protein|nr:hypothetical protein [Deltaproteobacteria bacterium]
MLKDPKFFNIKIIFLVQLLLLPIPEQIFAEAESALSYNWIPQYYGKIEGQSKLLYTRSFARSQLRFADIDNDGDSDLFVGKADGRLAFFINQGSRTVPLFKLVTEDFEVIHAGIDDKSNPTLFRTVLDVGENAAPEFADIDNDGDYDMFIGSKDGHIFHYENRGNRLSPKFFRKTPIYMGLKFVGNSVPRFADVNGDRAYDLIVGTRQGALHVFFNSGMSEEAIFCEEFEVANPPDERCKYQPELVTNISPLVDVVPELVDWDQDGDWDIIAGKSDGKINFYLNSGGRYAPNWNLMSRHFQFFDAGGFVAPTFFDLNHDNFPELFLGTASSRVIYYENQEVLMNQLRKIKSINPENFNKTDSVETILSTACTQLNGLPDCLPVLSSAFGVPEGKKVEKINEFYPYIFRHDLSIDSFQEDVTEAPDGTDEKNISEKVMSGQENIELERRSQNTGEDNADEADGSVGQSSEEGQTVSSRKAENERINKLIKNGNITRNQLWLSSRNYFKIENLVGSDRHSFLTSGDWNKDGRLDIMLGSRSGEIFAFENHADKGTDWYQIKFPSLKKNKRKHSSPVLSDIDGDGDLDIISGNRQGKIEWLMNRGTEKKPDWIVHDVNLSQIDVGSFSKPFLLDMDGDEDLDLLIGNSKGLIIYYQNQGDKSSPHFVLRNTRISGIQMKGNASPSFWNWNKDEHPDLFVGGREGYLSLVSHTPPERSPALRGWNLESTQWQNLRSIGYSTPHFADIDGDNKTDLLMGDVQGNLLYWKNGGINIIADDKQEAEQIIVENTLEEEEQVVERTDTAIDAAVSEEEQIPQRTEPIEPIFEFVSSKFGDLDLGRRAFPAFLDVDGDSFLDLVVGNNAGELRYYRSEHSTGSVQWILESNNFLGYQGGKNAAPVFSDLDGDGDLDLLVGNQTGNIQYWENKGISEFSDFVYNPTVFIGVTGGRNSVPAVIDLNSDGRKDLLLGNFNGQLYQYMSKVNGKEIRFRLERRKYFNLDVGMGSVPVIADINNDQQPELIIGSDSGNLFSFQANAENEGTWEPTIEYFNELNLPIGGNPVFVDLDKDGDLDLIVGSEEGTLHYFRNAGE